MGSAASRDETVKCEINDFDNKHKAMFKKIEQALHEERRLTVQERKDLDDKVNNFVRKNLKNREDQFMSDMERVMNIAKTDKITRDDQYRGIMDAWLSIIKSHDMELSDSVRDGLVRDMEAVYAKDKQISDFTYEREVLAALENDLYADKLVRDNLYRELMVQIADAIKTANQEMYRKHSGTTYHLENQLSVKDKEFQIKNGIAVKQKFETVFQNTTKTGIELVKQKGRVSDIVREDKAEVDKKRQQYGKILAAAIHSDQHWVDDHSTQLINKLDRLITDYRGRITSLNREMAPHVCRTVWKGEDCLYQRYRAMKYR